MPLYIREFIIELADRFPDLEDQAVIDAAVEYWNGAIAYRRSIISLYSETVNKLYTL